MDDLRSLNEKEVIEVIRKIQPKIVVPIHYKWHNTGEKIVKKVKEIIDHEKDILFKIMTYGKVINV